MAFLFLKFGDGGRR